ncbi:iron chelate uptake ABC transporter family permease subunit [Bacillus sp. SL00103]
MSLGKEHAVNLGIDYDSITKKMLIVIAVLVSIATALVGPITFPWLTRRKCRTRAFSDVPAYILAVRLFFHQCDCPCRRRVSCRKGIYFSNA